MLRGNAPARIDEKGRLKIPSHFRRLIEEQFGRDVFVTSITGESVRVYPMPVWIEIENKLAAVPSFNPTVSRFLSRVNYYGMVNSFDQQGRLLIHPLLRRSAEVTGEVAVLGNRNHLDVWNRDKFESKLGSDPFSEEDHRVLSTFGI